MRLSMILRELRNAMEAQATEAATLDIFSVLSVPPGTQIAEDGSFIWPDGSPCTASTEFTPYEPTEDWTAALPPPAPSVMNAETAAPIDVPDDGKITVLHPYQRRHPEPGE